MISNELPSRPGYNGFVEASPKPRSMERIGEEFLAIVWEDGHESFYEAPLLRKGCPCAGCRAQAEQPQPLKSSSGALAMVSAPPRLIGMEEVGRYAVRLRWNDGHSSGLYEYRMLRSLCSCELCRRA